MVERVAGIGRKLGHTNPKFTAAFLFRLGLKAAEELLKDIEAL